MTEWITANEAANILNCSYDTIRRYGKLPEHHPLHVTVCRANGDTGRYLYSHADVIAVLMIRPIHGGSRRVRKDRNTYRKAQEARYGRAFDDDRPRCPICTAITDQPGQPCELCRIRAGSHTTICASRATYAAPGWRNVE